MGVIGSKRDAWLIHALVKMLVVSHEKNKFFIAAAEPPQ
jgi:hypothetical protein